MDRRPAVQARAHGGVFGVGLVRWKNRSMGESKFLGPAVRAMSAQQRDELSFLMNRPARLQAARQISVHDPRTARAAVGHRPEDDARSPTVFWNRAR